MTLVSPDREAVDTECGGTVRQQSGAGELHEVKCLQQVVVEGRGSPQ